MGINFKIASELDIKEEYPASLRCDEIPVYLARLKARAYIDTAGQDTIIIAADTIVCHKDQVLGKPANKEDAVRILKLLSGDRHTVITGICLKTHKKEASFCTKSEVSFKDLSGSEIDYYINKYKPFDKAGSYGIQEWIGYIGIKKIDGSYFNVMGLPTQRLYTELSGFIDNSI